MRGQHLSGRLRALSETVAWVSLSLCILIFAEDLAGLPMRVLAGMASVLAAGAVAWTVLHSRRGIWSTRSIFLSVFVVFHFGLVAVWATGLDMAQDLQRSLIYWVNKLPVEEAIVMSTLGVTALLAGMSLAELLPLTGREQRAEKAFESAAVGRLLAVSGFWITTVAVGLWFAGVISRTGVVGVLSTYGDYLEYGISAMVNYLYYFVGLGMLLLAAAAPSPWRLAGAVVLGVWAVFAFPLGLRGELLFPAVTALAVISMRRAPLKAYQAAIIALFLLAGISGVRQYRQEGWSRVRLSEISFSPVDALAEMGGTVRPVAEVIQWSSFGETHLWGASYWAPVDRALYYVVPGWSRLEAIEDMRLMSVRVMEQVGPIGFSPVAEAYVNFGEVGVLLMMLLFGLVVGRMERWPVTRENQVKVGVVLLPLIIMIRNDFVPVPFQLAIGFFTLSLLRVSSRLRGAAQADARAEHP
jgi:hypothetical protein